MLSTTVLWSWTTTRKRMSCTPRQRELFYDIDENALFYGDGNTRGGVKILSTRDAVDTNTFGDRLRQTLLADTTLIRLLMGLDDSVDGFVAVLGGPDGKLLTSSGKLASSLVTGPTQSTSGNLAIFADETGKALKDSHWSIGNLVVASPRSQRRGGIPIFAAPASGQAITLLDSGESIDNFMTKPASAVAGNIPSFLDTSGRMLGDSGKSVNDLEQSIAGKAAVSHTHKPADIGAATPADIDDRIKAVVGAAPAALDTLKELADALGSNANFASTVTTELAGKAAANHTHAPATTTVPGFISATDKAKLDGIATSANAYTLPAATGTTLGGVKVGNNVSIDADGILSASADLIKGPSSSVAGELPVFDGTNGKTLKSSGRQVTDFVTGPTTTTNPKYALAYANSTDGKSLAYIPYPDANGEFLKNGGPNKPPEWSMIARPVKNIYTLNISLPPWNIRNGKSIIPEIGIPTTDRGTLYMLFAFLTYIGLENRKGITFRIDLRRGLEIIDSFKNYDVSQGKDDRRTLDVIKTYYSNGQSMMVGTAIETHDLDKTGIPENAIHCDISLVIMECAIMTQTLSYRNP